MYQTNNLVKLFILLVFLTTIIGCLSVAKLSDFPKTSTAIDYNKYSTEYHELKSPYWTSENASEYYFERDTIITNKELTDYIKQTLKALGYSITSNDYEDDYIRGSRGMTTKEWGSITAVYYKLDYDKNKLQVYILTKITQDISGGRAENRAKTVGQIIEKLID
jgi:hypothetical protein